MIPQRTKMALGRYVMAGVPTGGFLRSVLENNLTQAVFTADDENAECLSDIVRFVYLSLPAFSHGNPECVAKWIGSFWKSFKWQGSDFESAYKSEMPELLAIRGEMIRRVFLTKVEGQDEREV